MTCVGNERTSDSTRRRMKGKYRGRNRGERFVLMKLAVWWDQMNRGRDEKTDNSNVMVEVMMNILICISQLLKSCSLRLCFHYHLK